MVIESTIAVDVEQSDIDGGLCVANAARVWRPVIIRMDRIDCAYYNAESGGVNLVITGGNEMSIALGWKEFRRLWLAFLRTQ